MYYPYFLSYILIGLIIGLTVFLWALKNGQFTDQQRARFLALEDESAVTVNKSRGRIELYIIFGIVVTGIISSAAIIVYALMSNP